MFVVIIGGGKAGSHLAELLQAEGHEIALVEKRPAVLERLEQELSGVHIVNGDACDPQVLKEVGVSRADVVAVMTGDDEDNLVASLLAKFEFNARRVIARVNNSKNESLFTPDMGVDVAVSQAHIMAKLIQEQIGVGELMTLFKLQQGNLDLVQETLPADSRAVGKAVKDLGFPKESVLVAVVRGPRVLIPYGDTVLQAGDEVLALTHVDERPHLAAILGA
ncbi:MAG: TrkA family potassium uptake protein [Chloroflexi bacterium]|nr:TrkA family potassium uptake protein [Chloroflexota bacterium]